MKMTLTFDEETAHIAKNIAREEGTSVSALVRAFFRSRAASQKRTEAHLNPRLKKLLDEGEDIMSKEVNLSDKELIRGVRMGRYV